MRIYSAELYFIDKPEDKLTRLLGALNPEETLEQAEQSLIDDDIFFYLTEPDQLEQLMIPNNGESFVVVSTEIVFEDFKLVKL